MTSFIARRKLIGWANFLDKISAVKETSVVYYNWNGSNRISIMMTRLKYIIPKRHLITSYFGLLTVSIKTSTWGFVSVLDSADFDVFIQSHEKHKYLLHHTVKNESKSSLYIQLQKHWNKHHKQLETLFSWPPIEIVAVCKFWCHHCIPPPQKWEVLILT